jgi:hypothetical protein
LKADLTCRTLDYADPLGNYNCVNDGFQFHLTELRASSNGASTRSGALSVPYDAFAHNAYRIGGETRNIKQYTVWLTITGTNLDLIEAEVWEMWQSQWVSHRKRNVQIVVGQGFIMRGSLRKDLNIWREASCRYSFTYGSGRQDGIRSFKFFTDSGGYGKYSRKIPSGEPPLPTDPNVYQPYCTTEATSSGGRLIKCTFPGW